MTNQPTLEQVRESIRSHRYMSGVDRQTDRTDATEEVFTDTEKARDLVTRMWSHRPELFEDTTKTIIDPAVGDGQLLGECLIKRMESGNDFVSSLTTLRGLDLMQDNVELCRRRLICGYQPMRKWSEQYIVQGDCFKNDYTFGEPLTLGPPSLHKYFS